MTKIDTSCAARVVQSAKILAPHVHWDYRCQRPLPYQRISEIASPACYCDVWFGTGFYGQTCLLLGLQYNYSMSARHVRSRVLRSLTSACTCVQPPTVRNRLYMLTFLCILGLFFICKSALTHSVRLCTTRVCRLQRPADVMQSP